VAEAWIEEAPDFEIVAPRSLSLFNFRYRPTGIDDLGELDRLNEALLHGLNDEGSTYFTQNRVRGCYAIRWAIGQTNTERRHVEAAWRTIQDLARTLE